MNYEQLLWLYTVSVQFWIGLLKKLIAITLHCSWIGPRLSSQLPVVGSAAGEAGSPQTPAHTAADAGTDEREDDAEEDTYDHNSCNYPRSETGWLITCIQKGYKENLWFLAK